MFHNIKYKNNIAKCTYLLCKYCLKMYLLLLFVKIFNHFIVTYTWYFCLQLGVHNNRNGFDGEIILTEKY